MVRTFGLLLWDNAFEGEYGTIVRWWDSTGAGQGRTHLSTIADRMNAIQIELNIPRPVTL